MNRLKSFLPNGLKTVSIGVCLAVLPWLASLYFCPYSTDSQEPASIDLPNRSDRAESKAPKLLPKAESARCLQISNSKSQTILTTSFPAEQTDRPLADAGPALAAPTQDKLPPQDNPSIQDHPSIEGERAKAVYIPPSDIVSADVNQSSADSTAKVWMPKEFPIVEKVVETSPDKTEIASKASPETPTAAEPSTKSLSETPTAAESSAETSAETPSTTESPAENSAEAKSSPKASSESTLESSLEQKLSEVESTALPESSPTAVTSQENNVARPNNGRPENESFSLAPRDIINPSPNNPAAVVDHAPIIATDRDHIYPSTETPSPKATEIKEPERSEQMESIARQADQQTRHGLELAGRGAYYAARAEFIAALRLVAQGLDTEKHTTIHSKSLVAGLTALKEADDFIPGGARLEADLDLPGIIAGHSTTVLKDVDASSITPLKAIKSYFSFAQEQLAEAAGSEVSGSMALRAMGKLHEELAASKGAGIKAGGTKAMVFYQASLLVFPRNYMAANDLGVLLARNGNYQDACKMLEHSLSISRQSTIWNNLVVVYTRLGRNDMAQQARQQALIAGQAEQARRQNMIAASNDQVHWVDENAFAQSYFNPSGVPQNTPPSLVDYNNPLPQKAGQGPLKPATAPPVLQPVQNSYLPSNGNIGQASQAVNRDLPAMRPTSTVLLPKTQYDGWR
jgi:tetratricopeptide (TPR) repeat protein